MDQENDGRRRQDHEADLERGAEPHERKTERAGQGHDRSRNQEEPLSDASSSQNDDAGDGEGQQEVVKAETRQGRDHGPSLAGFHVSHLHRVVEVPHTGDANERHDRKAIDVVLNELHRRALIPR